MEKRKINIDPGYISLGNLVLATGKPFAHRPYLGSGIYADLTLVYQRGGFHPLEWDISRLSRMRDAAHACRYQGKVSHSVDTIEEGGTTDNMITSMTGYGRAESALEGETDSRRD